MPTLAQASWIDLMRLSDAAAARPHFVDKCVAGGVSERDNAPDIVAAGPLKQFGT